MSTQHAGLWIAMMGLCVAALGLSLVIFGNSSIMSMLFHRHIDPLFRNTMQPSCEAEHLAFRNWVYGVLGATVCSWGLLLAAIANFAFRSKQRWARNCIALALGCWYAMDTGISLACGVRLNVAVNTGILIAIGAPLALSWRHVTFGKTNT